MTGGTDDVRLHIDSDWKSEAAKEKERLAKQEAETRSRGSAASAGPTHFLELLNVLVMQAAVALGGAVGPGGERIPSNLSGAKYFIDLIEVLEQKTRGNLSEEERRAVESVLHELRMNYVSMVTPPPAAQPK